MQTVLGTSRREGWLLDPRILKLLQFLQSLFRYLQPAGGKIVNFSPIACSDHIVLISQTDDICFNLNLKDYGFS